MVIMATDCSVRREVQREHGHGRSAIMMGRLLWLVDGGVERIRFRVRIRIRII